MSKPIRSHAFFPLLLALTALSFTGCMTDPESPPSATGRNRTLKAGEYDNRDIGLRIVFPTTWESRLDQVFGDTKADLVLLDAPRNGFRPNLSVIYTPHSGPIAMSEILPQLKNGVQAQTPDLSQYQDSIIALNGKEVGRIDYESTVSGNLFHFRILVFVNNGQDVALTLTDRADDFAINGEVQNLFYGVSITPK